MHSDNPISIFWTGGWDSTFRVLYQVIIKKETIQPYYIKGLGRASQSLEISTMESIKRALYNQFPDTKGLIKDTEFIRSDNIPVTKSIKNSFMVIQKKYNLGNQYYFMAEFAKKSAISNIEVCIQGELTISKYISEEDPIHIDPQYTETDFYNIFGSFAFPILNMSKLEMKRIATKHNFIDLLNKSWFCHYPINANPCGVCLPCMIVMEEKLYSRMPLISKIRYYISPKRHIKSILKKNQKYNYIAKRLFSSVVK